MPSGWSFLSGSVTYPGHGSLTADYQHSSGATVQLQEGELAGIKVPGSGVGSVKFGDMTGTMYDYGAGVLVVLVDAGGGILYYAKSTGVSLPQFSDIVNAMHNVPKS